jgi:hypothetical protein
MQFGYLTLSDNHYDNNTGTANDFVADIIDEAVYAEEVVCIRRGSASITSAPWVCFLTQIWCLPMSPRSRNPRSSSQAG